MAKVYIGMPAINATIPIEMVTFLMALIKQSKHDISVSFLPRADISHARNKLIEDFLKTDNEYLLFLDDDNPPESIDFLDKLIEAKKPVISGLVPSRTPGDNGQHFLCIYHEGLKKTGEHEYIRYNHVPNGQEVFQIANCGMGCVLIEREVAELVASEFDRPCEMRMVWYYDGNEEGWIRDERMNYAKIKDGTLRFKRYMSEDLLFFERAREFGVTIWAHKGVQCEHIGNPQIISVKTHIGH